jgi:hypothetical protein
MATPSHIVIAAMPTGLMVTMGRPGFSISIGPR